MTAPQNERTHWLDEPGNIRKIIYALVFINIVIVIAGPFVHIHGHFPIEEIPGFYAVFGFVAYCSIIAGAVMLRKIVKREEDYYGE